MGKTRQFNRILLLLLLISISYKSYSVDIIKIRSQPLYEDKREKHKAEVIRRSLEISASEYGPFIIKEVDTPFTSSRALASLRTGGLINIFITPANELWNKHAIPIEIPIRRGLLSYRLLLVHKDNLHKFKEISSLDELNKLTAGLQSDWVTTEVFSALGIKTMITHNFEGLFSMLNYLRFDYIPRGIYEIYDELDTRKSKLKNLVVEPSLALHLPMASYIYVSPKEPRIAKRLESGLRKLVANGELKKIFNRYYADDITRANLKGRKIIEIENPYYNNKDLMDDNSLWYMY